MIEIGFWPDFINFYRATDFPTYSDTLGIQAWDQEKVSL